MTPKKFLRLKNLVVRKKPLSHQFYVTALQKLKHKKNYIYKFSIKID